jgi:hypothetical protein
VKKFLGISLEKKNLVRIYILLFMQLFLDLDPTAYDYHVHAKCNTRHVLIATTVILCFKLRGNSDIHMEFRTKYFQSTIPDYIDVTL